MSISVVIPYFNASSTIKDCLDSVISQTVPVMEIIVVDDASLDEHRQYLHDLAHNYPILRIIVSIQNEGAAQSRNKGSWAASGLWIAFLDADDVWMPNKIQTITPYLEKFDFISHDYGEQMAQNSNSEITLSRYSYTDFLIKNRISTPTVMVRKNKYIPFNSSYRHAEDYEVWLNYFYSNITSIHIHATLAHGFKRAFGESGLSANMRAMYAAEVRVLVQQRNYKRVSLILFLLLQVLWFFKFIVRLIKIQTRRMFHA